MSMSELFFSTEEPGVVSSLSEEPGVVSGALSEESGVVTSSSEEPGVGSPSWGSLQA